MDRKEWEEKGWADVGWKRDVVPAPSLPPTVKISERHKLHSSLTPKQAKSMLCSDALRQSKKHTHTVTQTVCSTVIQLDQHLLNRLIWRAQACYMTPLSPCLCVCACMRVRVCLFVCVRQRETEKYKKGLRNHKMWADMKSKSSKNVLF